MEERERRENKLEELERKCVMAGDAESGDKREEDATVITLDYHRTTISICAMLSQQLHKARHHKYQAPAARSSSQYGGLCLTIFTHSFLT